MANLSTWNVEFYANGEWQTAGRLTDEQIKAITLVIDTLNNANNLLEKEIDDLINTAKELYDEHTN